MYTILDAHTGLPPDGQYRRIDNLLMAYAVRNGLQLRYPQADLRVAQEADDGVYLYLEETTS